MEFVIAAFGIRDDARQNSNEALNDEESGVRSWAAYALGKIANEAAIPALIDALNDKKFPRCGRTAQALGKIANEVAVPALIDVLNDKKEEYHARQDAAYALGNIGNEAADLALIDALNDEESGVRRATASALGKIAN